VFDASVLARLTGMSGRLRLAVSMGSSRIIRAGQEQATVDVDVAGHDGGILHMECTDARILELDRRAVVIEFQSGGQIVPLEGSLEIMRPAPPYLVAVHPLAVPDTLQRRNWIRVPTTVAVRLADADAPPGAEVWHATTTRDLSPGGVCLSTVGDLRVGQRLRLDLRLASGQLELLGQVLDVVLDGTTRIGFLGVSESDQQRLLRHHVELQAARGYPYSTS